MMDPNKMFNSRIKICNLCGKEFIVTSVPYYTYRDKSTHKYYCSYTCYSKRKSGKKDDRSSK